VKEVIAGDRVENLGGRRAEHGFVREQHHRDQRGEIGVRPGRPRREAAALERAAPPLPVLEVEPWRVAPGPDLGFDDDRQLDAAPHSVRSAPPRDGEQAIDETLLLLARGLPFRDDEQVEIASWLQAAQDG